MREERQRLLQRLESMPGQARFAQHVSAYICIAPLFVFHTPAGRQFLSYSLRYVFLADAQWLNSFSLNTSLSTGHFVGFSSEPGYAKHGCKNPCMDILLELPHPL